MTREEREQEVVIQVLQDENIGLKRRTNATPIANAILKALRGMGKDAEECRTIELGGYQMIWPAHEWTNRSAAYKAIATGETIEVEPFCGRCRIKKADYEAQKREG